MSCPVPSDECSKAQVEDPARTYSWQECLDSEICPEFKDDFRKARLDCFEAERDYAKLEMSCLEARLTCPKSEYPMCDCPESKLVCDKFITEIIEKKDFKCPDYTPVLPCPEYVEAKEKYKNDSNIEARPCAGPERPFSVCLKARMENVALNISYTESKLFCLESEFNGTTHS
jgi:hypothetical protein